MQKFLIVIVTLLLRFNILEINEINLDINPIVPVYWINSKEIFVNEEDKAYVFNIEGREIKEEFPKDDNQVLGYEDETVFICEWENKTRDSIEEYSTRLVQSTFEDGELLNIELKTTLEVIDCREEITLKTVPPIEEKIFLFVNDLYEIGRYKEHSLSPNLKYLIQENELGNIRIIEFSIF